MTAAGRHDATASLVGYLYQVHVALLELLRRSATAPSMAMRMEVLDDVSFEVDASPNELLQTKHRLTRVASLTDAGRDLWKSVHGWADAVAGGIDPSEVRFSLLTTATAPANSIGALLRGGEGRDEAQALRRLETIARTASAATNKQAYEAFIGMDAPKRQALVESIVVFDAAHTIDDIAEALRFELRRAAAQQHLAPLADRLIEWWSLRVLRHLRDRSEPIYAEEVEHKIDDLRDQFAAQSLPIDVGLDDPGLNELNADDRTFVRQLQLIAAEHELLETAIRDYKRAYLQRSRWVRDKLILSDELSRYEDRLVDEWQHHRAIVAQRAKQAGTDEGSLQDLGLEVYAASTNGRTWLRRVEEPFVMRGTLQQLADELRVGWHPDFVARLRSLLEQPA